MLPAAILGVAAAFVCYAVLCYPLLLSFRWGRIKPKVARDEAFRPRVTTVLAVHNGEAHLAAKLENLLALDYPAKLREILVVSDGSTDATDLIASAFAFRGVHLLCVPRGGKAQAINAALECATGELLFFTDVRQELARDALAQLVANFADPAVGAATGELRFRGEAAPGEQSDVGLYWRYETWARGRHSEIDSMFGATGCVYAIRRSLAETLWPDTLADDVVMPLRVFLKGYRVILDPRAVAWDYRTAEGNEFRRKLRTLAGLWQVFTRVPGLFGRQNRMRFHFLSHKFSRLLLPWALLGILAATLCLPDSLWRASLLANECALGIFALADFVLPRRFFLKSLTSPARTFLTVNVAALLAVVVFLIPPGKLWGTTKVTASERKAAV